MADLGRYIGSDIIKKLGIKDSGSVGCYLSKTTWEDSNLWIGYDTINQRKYIIASKTPLNRFTNQRYVTSQRIGRTKWYVGFVFVPRERSEDAIPKEKLKNLYREIIIRKNAVLPQNLEARLKNLTNPKDSKQLKF